MSAGKVLLIAIVGATIIVAVVGRLPASVHLSAPTQIGLQANGPKPRLANSVLGRRDGIFANGFDRRVA